MKAAQQPRSLVTGATGYPADPENRGSTTGHIRGRRCPDSSAGGGGAAGQGCAVRTRLYRSRIDVTRSGESGVVDRPERVVEPEDRRDQEGEEQADVQSEIVAFPQKGSGLVDHEEVGDQQRAVPDSGGVERECTAASSQDTDAGVHQDD